MPWLDRQSFLGPNSDQRLGAACVGLAGLGGGNSHVAQQLAHLGIGRFVLVDDDKISLDNLNRLVGGTRLDVEQGTSKVEIIKRLILSVNPNAQIKIYRKHWQLVGDKLKSCDLIVGGLDNVRGKDELDGFCRRFLIPYIDLGMDVHRIGSGQEYLIAGQVVLSSPKGPCLRCLGIVTDAALVAEAKKYGDAGGKPQVVWPNGVLASTAVGLVVQFLTPWTKAIKLSAYFAYDGNSGTMVASERLRRFGNRPCTHYPPNAVGDMAFDVRAFLDIPENGPPEDA